MEIQYVYVKKRKDFGRQCRFQDRPAELMVDIEPDPQMREELIPRNPVHRGTQVENDKSEHEVNTEGQTFETSGMEHMEGGWPKDINASEAEQVLRYKKKIEKDESFIVAMKSLTVPVDHCLRQNTAVNIYEDYFHDSELRVEDSEFDCKAMNVFRDPTEMKRTATHISWFPEGAERLAVAYGCFDFQHDIGMETDCYIWNVEQSARPEMVLRNSLAMVTCLEFNPKENHILIGGAYNGQLVLWDTRKGTHAIEMTGTETSHRDPISKVIWLQSKTGTEFFSASTDARVLWWDTRKLSEPVENMLVDPSRKQDPRSAEGATCLEFETTIPTKFMVGTDRGKIISGNRKGKTAAERVSAVYSSHIGPVYALQRNPFYNKNFLTVGDWTARIWNEEVKDSAIFWTRNFKQKLTDGAWSPVRPGTFFTTRMDGSLDIWDICYRQKDPLLTLQVVDEPLYSLRVNESGRFLAVGSYGGVVTLMKCNDSLVSTQRNEKQIVSAIFERETRREKYLEVKAREMKLKERQAAEEQPAAAETAPPEDLLRTAEEEFWKAIEKGKQELADRENLASKAKEAAEKAEAEENEKAGDQEAEGAAEQENSGEQNGDEESPEA